METAKVRFMTKVDLQSRDGGISLRKGMVL